MIDKLTDHLPHISCQKATRLISDSLDRRLSLRESALLKIHLFVCDLCQNFRKQSTDLHKLLRQYNPTAEQTLSIEIKNKLKESLKTH